MKHNRLLFVPECHADTTLIQFLKVPIKIINHAYGLSKVAKAMERHKDDFHKVIVGVIDNDKKNTPRYFDDFIELKAENGILLRKKPDTNHFLIILCPEFEALILETAHSVQVNSMDYNLPDDPGELHKVTQQVNIAKNQDFMNFMREIRRREAIAFQTLQNWLSDFTEKSTT